MNTRRIRVGYVALAVVVVLALLIAVYGVYPQFERTSVALPSYCRESGAVQPSDKFAHYLPGIGTTTPITSDAENAVVADIDFKQVPYPSTVYLVRRSDNTVLWSEHFANDLISAALADGTLYLYNDKIGYFIDTATGKPEDTLIRFDNFGGLSNGDRPVFVSNATTSGLYMETTAIISTLDTDGRFVSLRHVTFHSTAFNCFVSEDGAVTTL